MEQYLRSSQSKKSENDYMTHLFAHKLLIAKYLNPIASDIIKRSTTHDDSKLYGVEKELFLELDIVDENTQYGEDYYKKLRDKNVAVAIANHYMSNDHHPEHHSDGIEDMDLVQLLEMLVDWKVGGLTLVSGDIFDSIEKNISRFGIDDQLASILRNTAKKYLEGDYKWKKTEF